MNDLVAAVVTSKTMEPVNWAVVLSFLTFQRYFHEFVRRKVLLFPTLGTICSTTRGNRHLLHFLVLVSVPWQRPPLAKASTHVNASERAQASDLLTKRFRSDRVPPSYSL